LSGKILGFFHLEDEPSYEVRRPNKGEVGYFPDFGVANGCLDVVSSTVQEKTLMAALLSSKYSERVTQVRHRTPSK
jgi:hypothetical protein